MFGIFYRDSLTKGAVMCSFDVFFVVIMNKLSDAESRYQWSETLWHVLPRRHLNGNAFFFTTWCFSLCDSIVMPPPLGAGVIMFRVVRPSVRPSEAWNTLFPPAHGSVGPSDQPWPFYGMSVRPSGEVSGHLPENAWREWSEILHADVSWPPSELIRLWSRSDDFPHFGATLTYWNG